MKIDTFMKSLISDEGALACMMPQEHAKGFLCFSDPIKIITVHSASDIQNAFRLWERYSGRYYVAGFMRYELGYLLEPFFSCKKRFHEPVLCLGVYERALSVPSSVVLRCPQRVSPLREYGLSLSKKRYLGQVKAVKENIREGEIYQANLTMQYRFGYKGDPFALFQSLVRRQPVPYAAFIRQGKKYILSCSPELFFRRDKTRMATCPMKGTLPRMKNAVSDARQRLCLRNDPKNRAENIMIVDLIRNDLSKISLPYSVRVASLCAVQKYRLLFQMVSRVNSRLNKGCTYLDIFRALFPCGSIVGAPKIRAMQLLRELEGHERGVYCGSIGYSVPGQRALFNVAIRTLTLESSRGTLGIGGGIVWDSDPEEEYQECLLKGRFLTQMAEKG